ncbi:MAG: hypothetical protein ACX94A_00130 [Algiphilus sp.]
MTHQQLRDHLDRYGSDRAQWPWWARWQTRALLKRDANARDLLAEARQREAALARALGNAETTLPEALRARLLHIPKAYPQPAPAVSIPGAAVIAPWVWRGAAVGGTAAVIGFVAGMAGVMAPEWAVDWTLLAYGSY